MLIGLKSDHNVFQSRDIIKNQTKTNIQKKKIKIEKNAELKTINFTAV